MPEFTPEQYQFIGWVVVSGGGLLLIGVVALRKLGFDIGIPKRNGTSVPAWSAGSDIKTIKGNTFTLMEGQKQMQKDESTRAMALQDIRDNTRDHKLLTEQVLTETRRQTDEMIKALSKRGG